MRLSTSVLAAGLAAAAAVAATVPGAAAPASGTYNWSGFYVGGVASGGMFTVEQEDYWCWGACDAPTLQDWDASIGVQGGFNMQNGNFVYGIVADWSTGFEQDTTATWSGGGEGWNYSAEWNSYGTIRGRAGLAVSDVLVFGTAGIAIVDVDYSATELDGLGTPCSSLSIDCAAVSETEVGFAAGFGLGYPVADNMHLTFEYLYVGLPWENDRYDTDEENNPTDTDDYVSWTTSAHLARVALVWEFN